MPNENETRRCPNPGGEIGIDTAEGPDCRVTSRDWDAERRYLGHPTTARLVVQQAPRAL